jgi:hypothetical protein
LGKSQYEGDEIVQTYPSVTLSLSPSITVGYVLTFYLSFYIKMLFFFSLLPFLNSYMVRVDKKVVLVTFEGPG